MRKYTLSFSYIPNTASVVNNWYIARVIESRNLTSNPEAASGHFMHLKLLAL